MSATPAEASALCGEPWTEEQIRARYKELQSRPHDFSKNLPSKTDNRYIVIGGSGLVGGWIVQHLLDRGEDEKAIRVCDIRPLYREAILDRQVDFVQTDVTDAKSVSNAFEKLWPRNLAKRPLTVFHTVAYISPGDRAADFLGRYESVNVEGTRNCLAAAKAAGACYFIATSSGSVGLKPPRYFVAPWKKRPVNWFQVLENADPPDYNAPLESCTGCYAFSKLAAEKLVLDADDKSGGFRTGAIRPGHAIYGHGGANPMSIAYDYLRRGGSPTWIWHLVTQFVSAQNVSLAHLLFEASLAAGKEVGGNAYAVTDPGKPLRYGSLYRVLMTLADPSTPIKFPLIAGLPMYLVACAIEGYILFRHRYAPFLPAAKGDFQLLQPGMFRVSVLHLFYDITKTRNDLGYNSDLGTLEGLCQQMLDWNERVAKTSKARMNSSNPQDKAGNAPIVPDGTVS